MKKKNLLFLLSMFLMVPLVAQSVLGDRDSYDFVSVHDIQYTENPSGDSPYVDQEVSTGGIVTALTDYGFFIQSGSGPWSGVYVYDSESNVALGDSVTFTGTVAEYYNMTEIQNISNLVVVSQGNSLNISNITTAEVNQEAYEGCLINVYNAVCTNPDLGYGEWEVDDGSGACRVDDLMTEFTPTVNEPYSITGVVHFSYGEYKLEPRSLDDILVVTGLAEDKMPSVKIFPNPVVNEIHVVLEKAGSKEIMIYDATGKLVLKSNVTAAESVIDLSGLTNGVYFLSVSGYDKSMKIYKK